MLEIVNQLDGFDARGNIKVPMATNRLRQPIGILAVRCIDCLFCPAAVQYKCQTLATLLMTSRLRNILIQPACCMNAGADGHQSA